MVNDNFHIINQIGLCENHSLWFLTHRVSWLLFGTRGTRMVITVAIPTSHSLFRLNSETRDQIL
jgi:hypothetical protein